MRAFFCRSRAYLADPDFSDVPVAGLTAACYAKEVRSISIRESILEHKREGW